MKIHFIAIIIILLIPAFSGCKKSMPGKVEIISAEHLTHNSVVIFSGISVVQNGVGLQISGVCADKYRLPVMNGQSWNGENPNIQPDRWMTGISGLEPDTRYIFRAFVETNEGILYSDTLTIRTLSVVVMTDIRDNNRYPVKKYGDQLWMLNNLGYQTPGSMVFENDPVKYPAEFGRLYPYPEALIACPPGWHLPRDSEWKKLEKYLGVPESELDEAAFRGSPAGGRMKEPGCRLWDSESGKGSTNESGFSVLPSGWYRLDKKEFTYPKLYAGFWSESSDSLTSFIRFFSATSDGVSRTNLKTNSVCMSVRCVKDE